ncbi:hypothetical protein PIB30_081280 [Stylosanthes scabra]|uniref:Uncharacterized protein n=1 Tax=Stylosanthes scabra TaxID=79078 RepID=A0ABU6TSZ1_9FABA|nr:hypothetical protein [Stylosanthes scabra]
MVIKGILSSGPGDSRFHEFFQHRVVDCRLHRHTYTASEFTPVTRIYLNPSWYQYPTVAHPTWEIAVIIGMHRRTVFQPTAGERPESCTRYFKLGCTLVTPFSKRPTRLRGIMLLNPTTKATAPSGRVTFLAPLPGRQRCVFFFD